MSLELYHIPIDHHSPHQLDVLLRSWVAGQGQRMIVTPNPEIVLQARRDKDFLRVLRRAHLSLPDGVGLCYATAALTDRRLTYRQTGVDTLLSLSKICEDQGKRLVLLGGAGETSQLAARNLRIQFPDLNVVGIDPGKVRFEDQTFSFEFDVLSAVRKAQPDVLAVAFGAGKQEAFLDQHLSDLPTVRVGIGIGGALDMVSGKRKRSPLWMRRVGLEWLWRVVQEPTRVRRIATASVVFPVVVAYDSLRKRRFLKAVRRVTPEVYRHLTGKMV